MATISKGIKLSYKNADAFVDLTNLQEIPDLGGTKESIEITTLADAAHVYTDGLISYGDSVEFKFLYEGAQFTTLHGLVDEVEWKVTLPGGESCTFTGTGSVRLDGVGVNAVLTYTLAIKPSSAMEWA
jgi:hypothetical protein